MNENRYLDAMTILDKLHTEHPAVWGLSEIVGRWIWITFPVKPSAEMRAFLVDLGFHWNQKRQVWQHCGGFPSRHANYDPRGKYGVTKADELQTA